MKKRCASKVPLSSRDLAGRVIRQQLQPFQDFDHVPWLPSYCQAAKAYFVEPANDGFNCPALFPLGSVLFWRCVDQSCLLTTTKMS